MRAPSLALALAVLVAACGDTLVDHDATNLGGSAACGEGLVSCDAVCTAQTPDSCGAVCGNVCPAAPQNADRTCTPTGPGGHDGVCGFDCYDGLLRCGSGCCAPALVAAGGAFSCATTTTGEVHCFGAGDVGQLGNGVAVDRATSAVLRGFAAPVIALVAGGAHACAIAGGTTKCWGNGAAFGASGSVLDPIDVTTLAGASALAAGSSHTCGIVGTTVRCVGATASAGGGSFGASELGGTALAIAAGDRFSCALVDTGTGNSVQCWGVDTHGELGDGMAGSPSSTPLRVGSGVIASTVARIAAGSNHACAGTLTPVGNEALWCWGDNTHRQIGTLTGSILGPTVDASVKKPIVGLTGGGQATCAIENDGAYLLSCRSSNPLVSGGSILTGEPNPGLATAPASGAPYAVSAGALHTCFVDEALTPARLKCFGAGANGRLGSDVTSNSASPVLVLDR